VPSVNLAVIARIDADLNITNDVDPEVRMRWYPTCLYLQYPNVYDPAHDWISSMGRSKYLNPVYQSLVQSGQHDLAVQWNNDNIDFYSNIAENSIMEILNSSATPTEATRPKTRRFSR
jgi:hypothetical protein